jgi:hypothetical protein
MNSMRATLSLHPLERRLVALYRRVACAGTPEDF